MSESKTPTTPVRYSWTGHLLGASEENREARTFTLGGDTTIVHAEFADNEDGSLSLDVVSNGPQTRHNLSRLVTMLQSVVAQESMAYQSEQETREAEADREEPPADV